MGHYWAKAKQKGPSKYVRNIGYQCFQAFGEPRMPTFNIFVDYFITDLAMTSIFV